MSVTASPPRCHVLLIGIDAYRRVDPLNGCVNDIDAFEAVLTDRLGVPEDAVTKLCSPHARSDRRRRVPEREASAENIRAALEALAGDAVSAGDRVLIYYAGHGTQVFPRRTSMAHEALVPVDLHDGGELLYDYDINRVLHRIAERTPDLTFILDCCCSAGATRSALGRSGRAVRFCSIDDPPGARSGMRGGGSDERPRGLVAGLAEPGDPGYLVAAACQSNESAEERWVTGGLCYGAFTRALLHVLQSQPDGGLQALRWAEIWQDIRANLAAEGVYQHPWLIGRPERRVFGGAFQPQDTGLPISNTGLTYSIAAGTVAGLSPNALVAVYGPSPDFFPPLDSPEDQRARLFVLRVKDAGAASCTAVPTSSITALPQGARARLIRPGPADALVVELNPFNEKLARWIEGEGPLRVIRPEAAGGERPEAYVGEDEHGRRWIGDEIFGPGGEEPLIRLPPSDNQALVRGLLHYARYNLALRLPRRCRDLPGALIVRVLDAGDIASVPAGALHDPELPETAPDPEHRCRYRIEHGRPVAIMVENTSGETLYTNLLNCATSGRVEILGSAQLAIAPRRRQTFWLGGNLGSPFRCALPEDRASGVDRLIAVGTTDASADLSSLRLKSSITEAVRAVTRGAGSDKSAPAALWTATLITMKIIR